MALRDDVKRQKTGLDLNTVEGQLTSTLSNVASLMNTLGNIKTHVDSKARFDASDRADVDAAIAEAWDKIWRYAVDNTPAPVKAAYPA